MLKADSKKKTKQSQTKQKKRTPTELVISSSNKKISRGEMT